MTALEGQDDDFDKFIESISSDVLRVLNQQQFFDKLERVVFPEGDNGRRHCTHSYEAVNQILKDIGFSESDQEDVIAVFRYNGGFCDCEVLYNVDDRQECPRSRYWHARRKKLGEVR